MIGHFRDIWCLALSILDLLVDLVKQHSAQRVEKWVTCGSYLSIRRFLPLLVDWKKEDWIVSIGL